MTSHPVAEEKAALRSAVLAARAALPVADRVNASASIRHHLAALDEVTQARALIAYAAFGAEVDLDPLLEELIGSGAGVLLPWVDGKHLRLARVRSMEADLVPGWRGVREPRVSGRREARADRVDAVLVPLVAFGADGSRLGYGGGHFDRLLASTAPGTTKIGVAFAAQQCDCVPTEPHDVPLDIVVTEHGATRMT